MRKSVTLITQAYKGCIMVGLLDVTKFRNVSITICLRICNSWLWFLDVAMLVNGLLEGLEVDSN
jgi:hypothetical protein